MCEILIITLFVILMVVPLAVVLIAVECMMRRRVLKRNRVCNSRPLQTSRKVFESEICARLVGRTLGIVYWTINVAYLIKESLIIVEYYFGYLVSQDANTATQIQVVETILICLVVIVITIFFVLDAIMSMCITFRQEKNLLKPHICAHCQNKKWQKTRLNQAVRVGSAWLKVM